MIKTFIRGTASYMLLACLISDSAQATWLSGIKDKYTPEVFLNSMTEWDTKHPKIVKNGRCETIERHIQFNRERRYIWRAVFWDNEMIAVDETDLGPSTDYLAVLDGYRETWTPINREVFVLNGIQLHVKPVSVNENGQIIYKKRYYRKDMMRVTEECK